MGSENSVMSPIIPGLIDDLGRECLIRMPYQDLPTASSVCKKWRDEVEDPDFCRLRKVAGVTRPRIVLSQAQPDPITNPVQLGVKQNPAQTTYLLCMFDPENQFWTHLPVIPGLPEGLPMFCGLVGSGSELVVIGGWDPVTWQSTSAVYVYSFISGKWRKGADMPGVRRSFFGCAASDRDRTVLVAGGHDEDKNALRSALLYDVENDKWVPLPDIAKARDECKVIFHRGRFHVVSGYPTDTQGCFERTAEVYDPVTCQWDPVIEDFLEAGASPGSCVAAPDGRLYACVGRRSGDVAVQVGNKWRVIAKVPADVRSSQWVAAYEDDKLLVIGSSTFGEPHEGYTLDLKTYKWTKVDVPKEYSGHVQYGCVIEL